MEHRQFNRDVRRMNMTVPKASDWKLKTNGPETKSTTQTVKKAAFGKKKRTKVKSTSGRKMKFGKNSSVA